MEKVENPTLETLFDLKRAQLHCTTPPQQMFQRIPAHFCEMVSQVGFHAEFAPPKGTWTLLQAPFENVQTNDCKSINMS